MTLPIPEKTAWYNARNRCRLPSTPGYENYGGRGIEFRLLNYQQIIDDIGKRPSRNHTLDRIDNDGHYEVGNIRWATRTEQNRNRRPVSAEGRQRMSEAAKKRCTSEWRDAVSKRVKKQHQRGKFGRSTWKGE